MNKPQRIGLLASNEEILTHINLQKEYELDLIQTLFDEYQVNDTHSLAICLAKKFHPIFLFRYKSGAKLKWSEYLNALLAFEIDKRKSDGSLRKTAILKLLEDPQWHQLAKKSKDKFELFKKADKLGRKSKIYPLLIKHYKYLQMNNTLDDWEEIVKSTIHSALNT